MATNKKIGLNPEAHLVRDVLRPEKLAQAPTRDGYGDGLVEAGKADKNVVALCADLTESTRTLAFKNAFPDRFIQIGVSEQCMPSIAAGLSLCGKIPFIASYACFSPGRNWEQIRTCVALQESNVKIAGAHAGVSVGPDGATHQMLEDIALMRVMPRMRVISPCDSVEAKKATMAVAKSAGPAYVRFGREKSPIFTTLQTPFQIGRAEIFRFGSAVTIIATGPLLYEALIAAEMLAKDGLQARVINLHTIKPLDAKTIIEAAKETGAFVTVEEAQAAGGLGGAVCELLAATCPVPVERLGMPDCFGESGEAGELLEAYGLTAPFIAKAAQRAVDRKQGKRVSEIPPSLMEEEKMRAAKRLEVIKEALGRTPKKWGGKKPDSSLKSRQA